MSGARGDGDPSSAEASGHFRCAGGTYIDCGARAGRRAGPAGPSGIPTPTGGMQAAPGIGGCFTNGRVPPRLNSTLPVQEKNKKLEWPNQRNSFFPGKSAVHAKKLHIMNPIHS